MLPALQQVYASWSTLQGSAASLNDVLELLEQPVPEYLSRAGAADMQFEKEISLRNLSFRYAPDAPEVLAGIDLLIPKGSRVGFIGSTGSGKSTLLDIVMGLLSPTSGTLQVDNAVLTPENQRAWQRHIAHVPQSIFLADSSIEENIAFGVPKEKIDHERVTLAARQAQIAGVIESMPKQYKTFVGERGVRLSGGQRQRIGIARALYKQADVIIPLSCEDGEDTAIMAFPHARVLKVTKTLGIGWGSPKEGVRLTTPLAGVDLKTDGPAGITIDEAAEQLGLPAGGF